MAAPAKRRPGPKDFQKLLFTRDRLFRAPGDLPPRLLWVETFRVEGPWKNSGKQVSGGSPPRI